MDKCLKKFKIICFINFKFIIYFFFFNKKLLSVNLDINFNNVDKFPTTS